VSGGVEKTREVLQQVSRVSAVNDVDDRPTHGATMTARPPAPVLELRVPIILLID